MHSCCKLPSGLQVPSPSWNPGPRFPSYPCLGSPGSGTGYWRCACVNGQRAWADRGRREAACLPARAAAATGAGAPPATSPTRPRRRLRCPPTASSPSAAPRPRTMASTRRRPATFSLTSPFPGNERLVSGFSCGTVLSLRPLRAGLILGWRFWYFSNPRPFLSSPLMFLKFQNKLRVVAKDR